MASRLFWPSWAAAVVLTGIVAGFMVSHVLLLGRFLDWLLRSGQADVLVATYPRFALSAGQSGLAVFYVLSGLQIIIVLVFFAVALGARRHRIAASIAAVGAVAWPSVHYASGFAAVERDVLRSTTEISGELAARFLAWNGPVHTFHAAALTLGLVALLAAALSEGKRED